MHRIKSLMLSSALLMQCAAVAVHADTDNKEHVQVETRPISYVERVAIQEERAEQEKQELVTEEIDNKEICKGCDGNIAAFAPIQQTQAGYHSTHLGAYHHPLAITPMGEKIELEDGSIWSTDPSHRFRTLNWMTYDTIIVTTNKDLFSSYMFRLVNLTTGQSVACNLSLGPIVNGIYTHWVISIDADHRELCLEDGSVWKLSSLDSKVFKKWIVNDTVIIGVNNRAFSCLNPNILINVNMLNYSRCSCLN